MKQPITELSPALTPIRCESFNLARLAGTSFQNAKIEIRRNNKKIINASGNLLITHNGFSGPLILNHSRNICAGDKLTLSFLGEKTELFFAKLMKRKRTVGKQKISKTLNKFGFTHKMATFILFKSGLKDSNLADATSTQLKTISNNCCNITYKIKEKEGWEKAMVTSGGIDLAFINRKTMESKIIQGLYFAGEILDIDGETGGYNLQAAFSTSSMAAESIKKSIE